MTAITATFHEIFSALVGNTLLQNPGILRTNVQITSMGLAIETRVDLTMMLTLLYNLDWT